MNLRMLSDKELIQFADNQNRLVTSDLEVELTKRLAAREAFTEMETMLDGRGIETTKDLEETLDLADRGVHLQALLQEHGIEDIDALADVLEAVATLRSHFTK